jgi:hypothetical protein
MLKYGGVTIVYMPKRRGMESFAIDVSTHQMMARLMKWDVPSVSPFIETKCMIFSGKLFHRALVWRRHGKL